MKRPGRRFETRVTSILLSIFLFVSIASNYVSALRILPNGWEIPVILGALIIIVEMLSIIFNIDNNIEKVIESFSSTNTIRYDTYHEFYDDLNDSLKRAKKSLCLTHIRDEPPASFVLGQKYFDSIELWCKEHPGASARRITAASNNDMTSWVNEQVETSKRCQNFRVRVCEWKSVFPMINMAILDDEKVFLAISSDAPERTTGIQIEDKGISKYFRDYFDNVWSNSVPADIFLTNNLLVDPQKSSLPE